MANPLRCSCPNCLSGLDSTSLSCSGQVASAAGATSATGGGGKPDWTQAQIAANLTRSNTSWATTAGGSVVVTFRFLDVRPVTGVEAAGYSPFSEVQKYAARIALQTWADAANIRFVESNSISAQIVFANTTSGPGQAWAYMPGTGIGGDVWINPNQASNFQLNPGGYGLLTMIHEIGHALGLSHPGDYDASKGTPTFAADAKYSRDSRQYTDMSYFSASNTGANHGSSYAATPLLDDILAIQRLYGVNTAVRNTATVYGLSLIHS
jgi:serralysin